ncbi:MAG TPA: thioredoxin-disulfide reductase, partial [Dehalococcoidales bacterium]|nr:thioredoxin-disulfide reductase [Dehalococcoidales bacterium]
MAEKRNYDVIIIGGGPAGLTAGLYASRAGLTTLLIEREMMGGQSANVEHIENYPGFPDGIGGFDLAQLMQQQAEKFGTKVLYGEATGLELAGKSLKLVKTNEGDFEAKAVIVTGAAKRRKLNVPGEDEFRGRGVSYCATCDAPLFRDQPVAVAGGGNSAITEALHLSRFASKVTLIHRRDQLRATAILQETAFAEPKINFLWDTVIEKIEGEDFVKRLLVSNSKTGAKSSLEVSGLFVSIGFEPDTAYLKGLLALDSEGHIVTNAEMETSVLGIYAAGDTRAKMSRQVITAAGDGA